MKCPIAHLHGMQTENSIVNKLQEVMMYIISQKCDLFRSSLSDLGKKEQILPQSFAKHLTLL